jgi:thymidylate synthase ThyX
MDTMNPTPKVTLVTYTKDPLETVYAVWEASKGEAPLYTTGEVKANVPEAEVRKLFRAVIAQHIPIGEHVDFVFMLENISISWREQAVRHRIGTLASPERVGADIVHMDVIPDLADSSWWSQSMRIQDMSSFATRGAYRLPQTVIDKGPEALKVFHDTMHEIERGYKALVAMGIQMEDARELMPLGAQHRMSWRLNIASLQHIVSKRGCWILQLGIWGPIITGMIQELADKVDPIFKEMVTPPCLSGDTYKGCVYQEEVRRRYTQDDQLPPCPLHLNHEVVTESDRDRVRLPVVQDKYKVPRAEEMRKRAEDYKTFWGRDPYTGVRESRS